MYIPHKPLCKNIIVKTAIENLQHSNNTIISGYASVFNLADSDNDIITKGAFANCIQNKIRLLWQHDYTQPLGLVDELYEDDYGLHIKASINNKIRLGIETIELIKQQAVEGLSIGFIIKSYDFDQQGYRLIHEIDLKEVSIVTFPANKGAIIEHLKQYRTQEESDPQKADTADKSQLALSNLLTLTNKII